MNQKIVFTVPTMDEKARKKAMKTAVVFRRVRSIAVEGDDNTKLVVVGVGVDIARMATRLKKLMGHATLASTNEVQASAPKKEEKKAESKPEAKCPPCWGSPSHIFVYDYPCHERDPYCSIM